MSGYTLPRLNWDWARYSLYPGEGGDWSWVNWAGGFTDGTLPLVFATLLSRKTERRMVGYGDGDSAGEIWRDVEADDGMFKLTVNPTSDPHIHVDLIARVGPDGAVTVQSVGAPWKDDGVGATVVSGLALALAAWSAGASMGFVASAPQLAASIGQAALGPELAAAYPGLANAVGQVAVNTAFNGGDIGQAVKATAASFVGANVGGAAASASGLDALGKAAGAATSAALRGGDIRQAATSSLVQSGITSGVQTMGEFFDDYGDASGGDFWDPVTVDTGVEFGDGTDPGYGLGDESSGDFGGFPDTEVLDPSVADIGIYDSVGDVKFDTGTGTVKTGGGMVIDTSSGVLGSLTNLALNALKVYQTWNAAGKPSIAMPGIKRNPNGSTTTPTKTGTLVTTGTNGRSTTAVMPIGKPYVFTDGSIVTNNGDGTYTTIHSDGSSSVAAYPANAPAAAASSKTGLLVGGAALGLGALLLLAGRRR